MTITFRAPPIPLAIGAKRCLHCKFWGGRPSLVAPKYWQGCRLHLIDRSPGATCPSWEPNRLLVLEETG